MQKLKTALLAICVATMSLSATANDVTKKHQAQAAVALAFKDFPLEMRPEQAVLPNINEWLQLNSQVKLVTVETLMYTRSRWTAGTVSTPTAVRVWYTTAQ